MVFAMIFWTYEKADQLYDIISQDYTMGKSTTNIILPVIWWTIYMHAFYLAYRVEKNRRRSAN
jgi:hypothetical protein